MPLYMYTSFTSYLPISPVPTDLLITADYNDSSTAPLDSSWKTGRTTPFGVTYSYEQVFDGRTTGPFDLWQPKPALNIAFINPNGVAFGLLSDGDDNAIGTQANDYLYGGAGKDYIHGNGGQDFIAGDQGDDRLFGGAGLNSIWGGDGNDGSTAAAATTGCSATMATTGSTAAAVMTPCLPAMAPMFFMAVAVLTPSASNTTPAMATSIPKATTICRSFETRRFTTASRT